LAALLDVPLLAAAQNVVPVAVTAAESVERLFVTADEICWQDAYDFLPDGSVVCRLSIRSGEAWITKVDVGSPSEQKDPGDRHKAAVSDALKRAAVKFGIGRYLYSAPPQWADYDPNKRRFVRNPVSPDCLTR